MADRMMTSSMTYVTQKGQSRDLVHLFIHWLVGLVGLSPKFPDKLHTEVSNFETAQQIDKRITDVSSKTNALEDGIKLGGITPRCFDVT